MDRDNAIRWAGIAAFVMLCLAVLYVATRTTPSEVAATQAADDRSRAALQAAKNMGKHVEVAYFESNVSKDLLDVADNRHLLDRNFLKGLWRGRRRPTRKTKANQRRG